jgi:ubiquinone/menaquinone biosynthesis C-methylase UbiE
MDHFGSQMRGRFVLDIAMGTGLVSQGLGDVLPQPVCHIGFDITQEMLDLARAKPSLSAHRMCRADVRSMPFRLNTFDVAVGSLFATPVERIAMFTDLKRILRKNGVLIIIDTPNNPDTPGITAELEEVFPGKQRKLQYTHVSQNAPGGFPLNYYLAVNDGAA